MRRGRSRSFANGLAALALSLGCAHAPPSPDVDPHELSLPDLQGRPVSLAGFSGKVLLVNFFATWCFPCLGEIPLLVELQTKCGADGLQVVGIGLDREAEVVLQPFADFYHLNYPVLVGADRFADPGLPLGPVHTLPTTVLISRDGKVLARWEGMLPRPALDALVDRALRK